MNDDSPWVRVVSTAAVMPGSSLGVSVANGHVAIHHLSGGQFCATSDVCSHEYARLSEGRLDGSVVECPLHGAQFDVRSGCAVRNPATRPIATFETEIRDGQVWLKLDASSLHRLNGSHDGP